MTERCSSGFWFTYLSERDEPLAQVKAPTLKRVLECYPELSDRYMEVWCDCCANMIHCGHSNDWDDTLVEGQTNTLHMGVERYDWTVDGWRKRD